MDNDFWWNWLVQLAIAIGTVGAVAVALFRDKLLSFVFPPRLLLELKDERGTKTRTFLKNPDDGTQRETVGRWYHGRVKNGRRWSPAAEVQVFLLRVEEPDATDEYKLTWDGEMPIRWAHQEIHPLARTIGYAADCDLCSVIKDKWVALHPLIEPLQLTVRHRGACNLIATFQARGVQGDSNKLRLQIAWNGNWSDDSEEMARHMVVKAV